MDPSRTYLREAFRRARTVEADIRERAARLDTYYGRIVGCRVVVEVPHRHHRGGNQYHVRIELSVPGGELVVNHEPSLHASEQALGMRS